MRPEPTDENRQKRQHCGEGAPLWVLAGEVNRCALAVRPRRCDTARAMKGCLMMKKTLFLPLALASAAWLGGCQTMVPPVDVTRFHQLPAATLAPGRYVIASPDGAPTPEWNVYATAVAREMQRLGHSAAGDAGAQYRVLVSFERGERGVVGQRSPVTVGGGVSTGSYGSGVGLGVGINLGGGGGRMIATQLSVQIRRADAAGTVLWEGRAYTEAGSRTPAAQPGLAADKLARALFAGFPGASGTTIRVP